MSKHDRYKGIGSPRTFQRLPAHIQAALLDKGWYDGPEGSLWLDTNRVSRNWGIKNGYSGDGGGWICGPGGGPALFQGWHKLWLDGTTRQEIIRWLKG